MHVPEVGDQVYTCRVTDNLILTQHQAHALLLQRTGYQQVWVPIAKRLGLSGWYDSKVAARTGSAQRERIGRRYLAECESDAKSLLKLFPANVQCIMDIGCGLAGVDLAISRLQPQLKFILVDQDRFENRPVYGFRKVASAYNSLDETRAFLSSNGLSGSRIETVDVLKAPLPSGRGVDVVLSVISWGFHYPVETYVKEVYAALRPGGIAILDIRGDTDGFDVLRESFGAEAVSQVGSPHSGISRALAVKE